jgi:hypothetical protein
MKRAAEVILLSSLMISTLTGCNQNTPPNSQAPQQQVQQKNPEAELAERLRTLETTVNQLQANFFKLSFRVYALESGDAMVSTEQQGYGIAKTNYGTFTVSTNGVTPYLDGFKVKLRIGNLSTANFNGAKISVSWGPPYDEKNAEEYLKNQKKKEFSVTNYFPAGSFTDVQVALTPAKPAEVKTLSVGIQFDQLSLHTR